MRGRVIKNNNTVQGTNYTVNSIIINSQFFIWSAQGGHRGGQGHVYRATDLPRPPYRTATANIVLCFVFSVIWRV